MTEQIFTVRHAGVEDAMLLRAIRLESLSDTPDAYGSTYKDSLKWPNSRWRVAAREWNYYLAERHGHVVGMASGGFNANHPGTRWLFGMYVTPGARGTGVAQQLVETVSDWARGDGATELYLHVTTTVARARAFYQKVGFRLNGEEIVMDRDRSIRLVTMVRDLA
jgi:GNAT superfamily N-acetyltransferase